MSFQFGFLTFHLYGLIIGLAVVLSYFLIEKKAQQYLTDVDFSTLFNWVFLSSLLGARIYHVLTDYRVYQQDLIKIFFIWQGGLGIIGAVMGGLVGAYFYLKKTHQLFKIKSLFDLSVFGLPFAQALGRWGNFVNFELYGLPTNLAWGIFIPPDHRQTGFENISYYHPLFFYESFLLFLFGLFVWIYDKKFSIGQGKLFFLYAKYYLVIRFILEFIRLEKQLIFWQLSLNQLITLFLLVSIFIYSSTKTKWQI